MSQMSAGGIAIGQGDHMDRVCFCTLECALSLTDKLPEPLDEKVAEENKEWHWQTNEMLGSKWPMP